MEQQNTHWYILKCKSLKEDTAIAELREKLASQGLSEQVEAIEWFKKKNDVEFKIYDPAKDVMPKSMKNGKTVVWEALPDNKFKRSIVKTTNRFPGYIFIKMKYSPLLAGIIRSVTDIKGFVGVTSAKDVPPMITIEKFVSIPKDEHFKSDQPVAAEQTNDQVDTSFFTSATVGSEVEIFDGNFKGMTGVVKKLNNATGIATISIIFFNREQEIKVNYNQFKI